MPDDRRFGVFWMDERALAAAFDMEGGFNDVALDARARRRPPRTMSRARSAPRAVRRARRHPARAAALALDARKRARPAPELRLAAAARSFSLVAAFVLNVALTRALALQRPQIAALKALGYPMPPSAGTTSSGRCVIGAAGVSSGSPPAPGSAAPSATLYNRYFRFPELVFIVPLDVVLGATALTLGRRRRRRFSAVRRAVRMPPAEAMRPEAPARYRRRSRDRHLARRSASSAEW